MIKPIKGIEISEPFFMAPLAGITDRSFRTLCAEQGASMLYSEMISAKTRSGNYQGKLTNPLAYAVFQLWSMALVAPIFINSDDYFADIEACGINFTF